MAKASVVSATELAAYLNYAGIITESDIIAELSYMALIDTEALIETRVLVFDDITDLPDRHTKGYIWAASMCVALEELARRGQVQQTSGDVLSIKSGTVQTTMQRWHPLFFFAKGDTEGFYKLLPHETYKMKSERLAAKWKKYYFKKTYPDEVAYGTRAAKLDESSDIDYPRVMEDI